MIAPKMPTRFTVGQAIVNDEANGSVDDGIRVIGLCRSNVGSVNRKMCLAFATIMLGVVQYDFDRTTGRRIAEVVELSTAKGVPSAGVIAVGTPAFFTGK